LPFKLTVSGFGIQQMNNVDNPGARYAAVYSMIFLVI